MERFRERFDVRMYPPIETLLEALVASYREWGGTASPPRIAIVDWREVPTFSEFELLRDAFIARGVPTVVCDPRDLVFDGGAPAAAGCTAASASISSTAACSSTTSSRAPDECRALVDAYQARAVCVANSLRCKIPHKKAFFAVLTDERHAHLFSPRQREIIRRTSRGRAIVATGRSCATARRSTSSRTCARTASSSSSSRTTSTAAPA